MTVTALDALTSPECPPLPLAHQAMGFQGETATKKELETGVKDVVVTLREEWTQLAKLVDGVMMISGAGDYAKQA